MPDYDSYMARRAALQKKLVICKQQISYVIRKIDEITRALTNKEFILKVEKQVNNSNVMQAIMHERFTYERAHGKAGGLKWKQLTDKYKKRKKRGTILVTDGDLRDAAKHLVKNTFKLTEPIVWSNLLGEIDGLLSAPYGAHNNSTRPFLEDPTDEELQPAYDIANMYVEQEINRILA